ncbi:tetraacyldisaccharide 4'-kinase [Algoriphagus limi]|uniref:Tetraacyldisaccharide 4'-kinase n=1 Tax=Algoriphagus limi TaxID=2975273 RepID=A0ABT2G402_9BACT|nr:tetraacyldisaccharide 4'-kinase [Algoriphagus limi]MCS5489822.1 tetraacyldisaccharide 4'-kinase [Algoriphagus limi]
MRFLLFLLFPFAGIYNLVTWVRNVLFDRGILQSQKSKIPTISVGNLRVGGTGKTPMVEYLIRLFRDEYSLAILSRGYGRKTKGFLEADSTTSANQIGDEPFQIYEKFGKEVGVYVSEKRVLGVEKIQEKEEKPDLIILDDAFQHRYITPDFSILLTTWEQPFFNDYLLPMGRLRESRNGVRRADLVIVTKSPSQISKEQEEKYLRKIQKYTKSNTPVFFANLKYGQPKPLFGNSNFQNKVILFTGLADPSSMVEFCKQEYILLASRHFPDHHHYTNQDIQSLQGLAEKYRDDNPVFLTTEKDGVKVKSLLPKGFLGEFPIFVLPIEAKLNPENEEKLKNLIQQKIFGKSTER